MDHSWTRPNGLEFRRFSACWASVTKNKLIVITDKNAGTPLCLFWLLLSISPRKTAGYHNNECLKLAPVTVINDGDDDDELMLNVLRCHETY